MSDEQEKIFDLKYASPTIRNLSDVELSKTIKSTLFKISVITGWPLPEQQEVRNILYDQLEKKLKEDYQDINAEEIEYAARAYGTTIKDWGKNINLSMLDEILIPYLSKRKELSDLEARNAINTIEIEAPPPEPLSEDEWIELARNLYLKSKRVEFIPVTVYEILTIRKEIDLDNEDKARIRQKVENRLSLQAEAESLKSVKELKHEKNTSFPQYDKRVRKLCKQQAVADYFELHNNIDNF